MSELDDLPVLTEVLVPGHADRISARMADPYAVHARASNAPQSSASDADADADANTPATTSAEDWENLERDVREAVLKGLQGRIDMVLDQRLKETLANLLEQVLAGMTAELKVSLRDTMREVVSRAVAQEISRLQATRAK